MYVSSSEELRLEFVSNTGTRPMLELCEQSPFNRTWRELSTDGVHYNYKFTNGALATYGCQIEVHLAHAPSSNLGTLSIAKTNDRRQQASMTARLQPNPLK